MNEKKQRLIVLTDINRGIEIDDIQSLVRLLLYSNEIDIEGLIATTSCFLKRGARKRQKGCILRVIAAYEKVKGALDAHAEGYPSADRLRSVTCCGVPVYGKAYGNGFGEDKWSQNEGVRRIIEALRCEDERPLWVALWGGANTLSQAVWTAEREFPQEDFERMLRKLRIYAISDQDAAGLWLRERYGDRLFYIVSPCPAGGAKYFYRAAWPGISADHFPHGYNGGSNQKIGFGGADARYIGKAWLKENIVSRGIYGKEYPYTRFIMEGDTPSYLSLIQNGLNDAEHPEYGGWGGRYVLRRPAFEEFETEERFPIWTNAEDTVEGVDGRVYKSAQATIWRWREDMQNDFASRMRWAEDTDGTKGPRAPKLGLLVPDKIAASSGERVRLRAEAESCGEEALSFAWFVYPEAGTAGVDAVIEHPCSKEAVLIVPQAESGKTVHVILRVKGKTVPYMARYARIIIEIQNER